MSRILRAVFATGMLTFGASGGRAQAPGVRELLVRDLALSPADLDALSRGEIIAKVLPTADQRDVAVFAAARTDRRARALLATTPAIAHVFARPAALADAQEFRITRDDIDDLRQCGPSSCNFKLPASAMQAMRAVIDSGAPGASDRVTAYVRRLIVDYVDAYRARGSAAMVVYDDLGSVQSNASFDAMVRDSSRIFRAAPALAHFITAFPNDSLSGATSALLWSVDTMPRLRPVLRIMHRVVYVPPNDSSTMFVISKQLYADHYFEAGLEALMVTDAANAGLPTAAGGNALVIETRRYRFDHLPSGGLLDLRGRVVSGLRGAVADDLKKLRDSARRGAPRER